MSEAAQNARRIKGLADLDGVEFLAKITVAQDQNGNDKIEIKFAITPDHKDYAKLMGNISYNPNQSQATQQPQQTNNRPAWAQ